jgi:hypothetical protein
MMMICLSHILDSPHLEGQVRVFISLRKRVAQLHPRHWVPCSSSPTTPSATVEAFEPASTRAPRLTENSSSFSLCSLGTDRIENTASNNSYALTWLFVTAQACLPRRGNVFTLPLRRSGWLLLLNYTVIISPNVK